MRGSFAAAALLALTVIAGPSAVAKPAIPAGSCMGIDPDQMVITGHSSPINPASGALGTWLLRANKGKDSLVIAYLDYKSDAEEIIRIAKERHWNRACFVGNRGGAAFQYMLSAGE